MRGQEERDMLLGRLFTCLAVARSGRLQQPEGEKEWDSVCAQLLETAIGLFAKRKVLRSLAAQAVVALVDQMPPALFSTHVAIEKLGAALGRGAKKEHRTDGADAMAVDGEEERGDGDQAIEELNPDQLLVALAVQSYLRKHGLLKQQQPGSLDDKLPGWLLTSKRLLRAKRIPRLVEPLKTSSAAFPRVHPVWDRLLEDLLGGGGGDTEGDEAAFAALWATVVDGTLARGTHERKALSLMLLQKAAPRVSAEQLAGCCLSPHVLRVLLAALSTAGTADQVLQPLARKTLEDLLALAAERDDQRLAVASGLLARCDVNFDMKTGTRAVQGLLEGLGPRGLLAFVRQLARDYEAADSKAGAGAEDGDEDAAEARALARKVWSVDALYALSKSPALAQGGQDGAAVVVHILRVLLALAYMDTRALKVDEEEAAAEKGGTKKRKGGKKAAGGEQESFWVVIRPPSPVPRDVRQVAAARLHSLLADLGKRGGGKGAASASAWSFEGVGYLGWLWAVHEAVEGLEGRGAVLAVPLSEGARAARDTMLDLVREIKAGAGEERMSAAFAALIMQVGMHQLRVPSSSSAAGEEGEEEVEDDGVLGDLCRCYRDLTRQRKGKGKGQKKASSKGTKKKGAEEEDEAVDAMAVLADVCVSALSSASGRDAVAVRGLREVIRKAWGLVCGSCPLSRQALDVLLGVVCKTSAGEGDEGEGGDGSESDEREEEDGDDEDGDEEDEALAALDRALKAAGMPTNEKEKEAGASDDGGDSSSGDEEGSIVVDGTDAAAFLEVLGGRDEHQAHLESMLAHRQQHRQGTKTSRFERERGALQLRLRALDLLEVAVAKQPQSPLLLLAIRPCLQAIGKLQAQAAGPGRPAEAADLAKRLEDFVEKRLVGKARPKLTPGAGSAAEGSLLAEGDEVQSLVQALLADLRKAPTAAHASLLVSCLAVCTRSVLAASAPAASGKGEGGAGAGAGAGQGIPPPWLSAAYRVALTDFMTKRTALTAAPFEELVARFPSPAALILLPLLPQLAVRAEKAFRQAEAFRIVGLLLGQRRALGPEAAGVLTAALGDVLGGLATVLEKGEGELTSKRLKPLVDCAQAVAQAMADAGGAGHAEDARRLAGVLGKVKEATASEQVKKQCASVAKQLMGDGDEASGTKKGKGKGSKKRKQGEMAPRIKSAGHQTVENGSRRLEQAEQKAEKPKRKKVNA